MPRQLDDDHFAPGAQTLDLRGQSGVLRARPTPMPTAALPGTESVVGATGGGTATPTLTQAPTGTPPPTETPTPAFSPTLAATPRGGGTGQIAFVSERVGAPQIFLVSVDGTGVTQLTTLPDGACQPAWSPDGQQLLFISPCRGKDDEYPNAAIYRLQMGNLSIQPLITLVGSAFDPDWSKSGIAFTYVFTGKARIWVARSDGTGAQQISQTNAADRQPSWSPGADRLAYMNTSRAGQPTLFWMFQDGTFDGPAPDQVTRDRPASSPDWSPQGDRVAYVVDRQIWVVKWDTKGFGAVALTTKGPNADPDWSPDGKYLAFSRGPKKKIMGQIPELVGVRAEGWDICVADARATNRWMAVTTDGHSNKEPDWVPAAKEGR